MKENSQFGKGIFFACLAYFLWGLLPLYWKLLIDVQPLHILSLRIVLSLVLVSALLFSQRNFTWLAAFKNPKKLGLLISAGWVLCCNWGLYIWAVNAGHTIDASLGYYINPLVSVLLGMIFLRERLRFLQWLAVAVAFCGVLLLTVLSGTLPWVPLCLAFSFGFYGLLKKKLPLSALESLGAETLASLPIGLLIPLIGFSGTGSVQPGFAGWRSFSYIADLPVHTLALLATCGVATALPLYLFARGAKLLPLSTVGFAQFICPAIQLFIGIFVFGEAFPLYYFAAFALIWIAVILYIISLRQPAPLPKIKDTERSKQNS